MRAHSCSARLQLLADTRVDPKLAAVVAAMQPAPTTDGTAPERPATQDLVARVAGSVANAMGGAVPMDEYASFGVEYDVARCKAATKSNVVRPCVKPSLLGRATAFSRVCFRHLRAPT